MEHLYIPLENGVVLNSDKDKFYLRYAIVQHLKNDGGTRTLEDYDNEATTRKAFSLIKRYGVHTIQNLQSLYKSYQYRYDS